MPSAWERVHRHTLRQLLFPRLGDTRKRGTSNSKKLSSERFRSHELTGSIDRIFSLPRGDSVCDIWGADAMHPATIEQMRTISTPGCRVRSHRACALVRLRADEVIPAMVRFVTALKEISWVSCLVSGILLMISAVTEGVPYTSIAIRNEFWQDAIGTIGLFWPCAGVQLGLFNRRRNAKAVNGAQQQILPRRPPHTRGAASDGPKRSVCRRLHCGNHQWLCVLTR